MRETYHHPKKNKNVYTFNKERNTKKSEEHYFKEDRNTKVQLLPINYILLYSIIQEIAIILKINSSN